MNSERAALTELTAFVEAPSPPSSFIASALKPATDAKPAINIIFALKCTCSGLGIAANHTENGSKRQEENKVAATPIGGVAARLTGAQRLAGSKTDRRRGNPTRNCFPRACLSPGTAPGNYNITE
jgi:hypothetical protein